MCLSSPTLSAVTSCAVPDRPCSESDRRDYLGHPDMSHSAWRRYELWRGPTAHRSSLTAVGSMLTLAAHTPDARAGLMQWCNRLQR